MLNNFKTKETSEEMKKKAILSMLHNKVERQDENFVKEDEKILKKRNVEEVNPDVKDNDDIAAVPRKISEQIEKTTEENENKENIEEKAVEFLNINKDTIVVEVFQFIKESEQVEMLVTPSENVIMVENLINPSDSADAQVEDTNTNSNIISIIPTDASTINIIDGQALKDQNESLPSSEIIENRQENVDPQPVNNTADVLRMSPIQQEETKQSTEILSPNNIQKEILTEEKTPQVSSEPVPAPIKEEPHQPKKITFMSAKKEVDEFVVFIDKVEQDIKNKYGINLCEFNYEDILPDELKLKLVEEFFNSKEIIDLAKNIK